MPYGYANRALLKQQIVARVAAGETVKAICAGDAAMPCAESVSIWARRDPLFHAELTQAQRRGDWMRRFVFDEAKAAAFLARVAAGERITDLVGAPGMPGPATYRYWRRTQYAFQATLWRLREARYGRLKAQNQSRVRWREFDPAVADRIFVRVVRGEGWVRMLASDPSLPDRQAAARWRLQNPAWDRAMRVAFEAGRRARSRSPAGTRCTPELVEEIVRRIAAGASLRGVGQDPAMPCAQTLYAWAARWPEFAKEVQQACDFRDWMLSERMIDICARPRARGLAAAQREAAALRLRVNQLAKRPGWKRARARGEGRASD